MIVTKAVDTADPVLVEKIWSNSPEVSFIHPLRHEHGLDQVIQNVYVHLMGDTFSERKLSIKNVSIHTYGDTAWAEFDWDFAAKLRADGSPLASQGRESHIYRKEQGETHAHQTAVRNNDTGKLSRGPGPGSGEFQIQRRPDRDHQLQLPRAAGGPDSARDRQGRHQ